MATFSFTGKRVLVTGGGRGIGYEIAKAFHAAGAKVFIFDKDVALLHEVSKTLTGVTTISVDVTNWHEVQEAVLKLTPLDHVINNAGILKAQPLVDVTPEIYDLHMNVNLRGMFAVAQAFARGNRKTGHPGTLVNISSLADRLALWGAGVYAVTKAAVTRLTMALALEFTEYGIRTNAVSPSFVPTAMVTSLAPIYLERAAPTMERTPIKEPLSTDDIVNAVLFLSSSSSKQVNGTSLVIDGGCRAAS